MPHAQYTAEQIVARGQKLYDTRIRALVEPGNRGKSLVIDIETGDYEIGPDDIAASHHLQARRPGAALYAMRIGSATFGRIGRQCRGKAV